jgi:hypothetical protein
LRGFTFTSSLSILEAELENFSIETGFCRKKMLFFYKIARRLLMNNSAKNKALSHIKKKRRGWAFSATDFTFDLSRWKVDRSLTDLAKEGKIRRIIQELYDYPKYSNIHIFLVDFHVVNP